MSITVNGTKLNVWTKQYFNGVELNDISINGNEVWRYDVTPHPADLPTILTRTGGRTVGEYKYAKGIPGTPDGGSGSETIVYNYCQRRDVWAKCHNTGVEVYAMAEYSGRIDLTKLPDYEEIKYIKIYRYAGSTYTVNITPDMTTVNVSDRDTSDNWTSTIGGTVRVSATAGVSKVEYSYAPLNP